MQQQSERSPSESYFWPAVWAIGLHVLIFGTLFVSFAFTPELPPARPIVQATLYQLKSQSQATTQTNQKIAGEAKKAAAPQYETEQMEQKKAEQQKLEQQKVAAAKAAEQKKAEEARKAEEAAEAKKADDAKKAEEAKKQQADIAKKKAEEEAKKKAADEAKKKAAEEAKKKAAAEAAKKKAAEDAKKKAAAEAAKKKAAEEAKRKSTEDKKAAALADLLSDTVEREQTLADEVGDQVAGSLDDLIIKLISENWQKPLSTRPGMSVELLIQMLPDGTITNASVTRSSGDGPFDSSAVAAVRNVGRIPEMQQLDRATFDRMYRQRRVVFKPEDLGL
ncbi:cell envelope integrity protein TolA [Pseudomonas tohonis]|uniref:cell envelope integrity protein TolA n=1 Tax=Pseudomonas tohonis TaxID=2725477 RepID=UPI001F400FB2|nr:cell envelope integrity protein TolA [Pseudomonas tohonis]